MSFENLLSRLKKVKGRAGNFVACCPAHEDSSPSLAVKEQDGKIILHCFAGCTVQNIVAAVGMDMTDLFPPTTPNYRPQPAVRFYAADLLRVLHMEANIVMVSAYNMRHGVKLKDADLTRLKLAYARIDSAMEATNA